MQAIRIFRQLGLPSTLWVLVQVAFIGCGGSASNTADNGTPDSGVSIEGAEVTLRGSIDFPNAVGLRVLIDGVDAVLDGSHWHQTVTVSHANHQQEFQLDVLMGGSVISSELLRVSLDPRQ